MKMSRKKKIFNAKCSILLNSLNYLRNKTSSFSNKTLLFISIHGVHEKTYLR